MPATLLIAEDQRLFRQSLRLLLEREPDLRVVGEATDGREAFDLAIKTNPNSNAAKIMSAAAKAMPEGQFEMPMSLLICQLVIAAGRNPDWVTEVRATDGFCEIRRGEATIAPGTPISSYIGRHGSWMFGYDHA